MREFTFIIGFLSFFGFVLLIVMAATGQIHIPTMPAHH